MLITYRKHCGGNAAGKGDKSGLYGWIGAGLTRIYTYTIVIEAKPTV
jgi:hypothetical protein